MKMKWILIWIFGVSAVFAGDFTTILKKDSVRAGLCVVVGCSSADELIRAGMNGKFKVQGVGFESEVVDSIHADLVEKGLSGGVFVALSDGKTLPYVDHFVNAIVILDPGSVRQEEIMRVVAPFGVALFNKNENWTAVEKPYPDAMDEWPMFRHDLERSNQLQDSIVKVPSGLQWVSGSPMAEYMTTQVITSGGRIFYSRSREMKNREFEGTRGLLLVRDAFNGILLWKKELKKGHNWSRCCLAVHERRLYALMDEGMVAMDVETGDVLQTYEGVSSPEVSYVDGTLIFDRGQMAVDAVSGDVLWKNNLNIHHTEDFLLEKDQLIVGDKERIVCLDLKTGEERWRAAQENPINLGFIWKDLFFATSRKLSDSTFHAFNLKDGSEVWRREGRGFSSINNGLGWIYYGGGKHKKKDQAWIGIDPRTGEEKTRARYDVSYVKGPRCYPARSTQNYFMPNFGGLFFLDPKTETYTDSFAGRGTCRFGLLPSNGMVYQPVHTCSCYPLMRGDAAFFCGELPTVGKSSSRLVRGPAFDRPAGKVSTPNPADWPTLRKDTARSGYTSTELNKKPGLAWQTSVAKKISSPVIAGKNVYVAAPDQHQVVAIDHASGKIAWRYTASGTINSPPTISGNLVLFGSADGWAYCIDSSDGALRWRFRAAPLNRQMMNQSQIESLWPVPGNLLVVSNTVYLAAGRHAELNDGIFMYALDSKTGAVRWDRALTRPDYQQNRTGWSVDSCNNRILSSDGNTLHMDRHFFDLTTGEEQPSALGETLWGGLMGMLVNSVVLDNSHKGERFKYWTYTKINGRYKQTKSIQICSKNKANLMAIGDSMAFGIRQDEHRVFSNPKDDVVKKGNINLPDPPGSWAWEVLLEDDSLMNSILLSGDTLLVGGSDSSGFKIWKFAAETGEALGEIPLPAMPRFDGLAVAGGDLFVATEDGQILCFSRK